MRHSRPTATLALTLILSLAACQDDEVTAKDVSRRTSQIVSDVAAATIANAAQLAEHPGLLAIADALERLGSLDVLPGAREVSDVAAPAPDAADAGSGLDTYDSMDAEGDSSLPSEAEARAQINEWLATRIFTEGNVESSDEDSATFLLDGATVCAELGDDGCVSTLDAAELRVRAEVDGDDIMLTIMVGPARAAPLVIELSERSAAIEVDLAELKAALTHLAGVTGDTLDLPEIMEGALRLALRAPTDQRVELGLGVTRDLHVAVQDELGTVDVRLAASPALLELFADAASGAFAAGLDMGALALSLPWAAITDDETSTGVFSLDIGGAVLQASAQSTSDVVRLTLGLAAPAEGAGHALEAKKDGSLLLAADLNATAGRQVDVTVTPLGDDGTLLAFTPGVDFTLAYHLADVALELGTPSYLDDETYRLELVGDGPALVVSSDSVSGEGILAVQSGELRLTSSATSSTVVAHAGECVAGEEPDATEHPVLGSLSVSSCAP